jgi:hypothetical protein
MNEGWTAEGPKVGEVRCSTGEEAEGDIVDTTTEGAIVDVHSHGHREFPKFRSEACVVKHTTRPSE